MRWVAVSLLLMNLAYFAWQYLNPQPESQRPATEIPGVPSLQLLSERDELPPVKVVEATPELVVEQAQALAPTVEIPAAETAIVTAADPQPITCYAVGPFAGLADINRATRKFDGAGFVTQQRAVAEQVRTGFWVYVGPHDSVEQARSILKSMKEKGIRDVLIVSGSNPANAISVGVFRNETSATRRQQDIQKAGYEAKLEARFRSEARYWLDVEVWREDLAQEKVWQQLLEAFPDAKRDARDCR